MKIKIGTRGSLLAKRQTFWVAEKLKNYAEVEIVEIRTKGDKILDTPLYQVGDKGLFTKELDKALLEGAIDLAVHSLKDLPTDLPEELKIAAIPKREDPRDVWISKENTKLLHLPRGSTVATGSLRRRAQLLALRPDLKIENLRGNIDTRLRKLEHSNWAGILLAGCGLKRAGYHSRITEWLEVEDFLPAAGQGALAIVGRKQDFSLLSLVKRLDHPPTRLAVEAERSFLQAIQGGCQVPLGVFAKLENGKIHIQGFVATVDGKKIIKDKLVASPKKAGFLLAQKLLQQGAQSILDEVRHQLKEKTQQKHQYPPKEKSC